MTGTTQEQAELQPEDRERKRCLTEEVRGRLAEMAQITARTLGIGLENKTVCFMRPASERQAS